MEYPSQHSHKSNSQGVVESGITLNETRYDTGARRAGAYFSVKKPLTELIFLLGGAKT